MNQGAVDFYLLEQPSPAGAQKLACRVVEKAWRAGHRVVLLVRDESHCDALDDLLWTFSQGSFVPHARYRDEPTAPVVVCSSAPVDEPSFSAIVTLSPDPLGEAFHRLRIADIIGPGEVEKKQARLRYRYYREHGFEPQTHRI